jgi:hypothetical protein
MASRSPLRDRNGDRIRDGIASFSAPLRRLRRRRARAVLTAALLVSTVLTGGAALTPTVERYASVNGWWPYPPAAPAVLEVSAAPGVTPQSEPARIPLVTAVASDEPEPEPDPAAVLRLPGQVPAHGDGAMAFAAGRGAVLGSSGPVRRFRVAVERDSGEDVADFAALVEATLGDRRSWIGGGLRLQRVPKGQRSDFTVYLATRDTAQRMCVAGGVNLRVGGVPYTSCRTSGHVVINLDRWRQSSKPYRAARVPLAVYRAYVLNHEVGHQLGHHHEGCPRRGRPAPVMVQQTLTLRGCTPYPWPRRGGKRYAGPGIR